MMNPALAWVLLMVWIAGGCGPTARTVITKKSPVKTTRSISALEFKATGLEVISKAECQRREVVYSCAPLTPACITEHKVVLECPESALTVRAPWGKEYLGASGLIPIPWTEAGFDPLSAEALAILKKDWQIRSADGVLAYSFVPSDTQVSDILAIITGALDARDGVDRPVQPTALAIRFVDSDAPSRLAVEVSNTGNAPAHGVKARLRSDYGPLHGAAVLYGRIGTKQSKTWTVEVPRRTTPGGSSPMIVVEVQAENAAAIHASSRFQLERPAGNNPDRPDALKVDCRPVETAVAPGAQARLKCTLKNQGVVALRGLTYEIGVHPGKPVTATGPAEIPQGGQSEIELIVPIPASAKAGQKLTVIAAVKGRAGAKMSPPIEFAAAPRLPDMCNGELTALDYLGKRKKLEASLAQGALTQAEFDKYDAELIRCLP